MTKEITKAFILQQIQDKFALRELVPGKFTFSEEVIPTYDVESHCVTRNIEKNTVSITSAAAFVFFTVPQNERWSIRGYNVIKITGAYTWAGVYIQRGPVALDYLYLDLEAAQNTSHLVTLYTPVMIDPGDKVFINIDGYTSTGDLALRMDVVKEEIR